LRLPVAPAADGAVALSWQHGSVEDLAQTLDLHPKVIRKGIRLAFLAPTITTDILLGRQKHGLMLGDLNKSVALSWQVQDSPVSYG